MRWPLLCGVSAAILLCWSGRLCAVGETERCGDIKDCINCTSFTNLSNANLTCLWMACEDRVEKCVNSSEASINCTKLDSCEAPTAGPTTNSSARTSNTSTSVPATIAPTASSSNSSTSVPVTHSSPLTPNATSLAPTTGTSNATTLVPPPPSKKSTFDAASFIGGIVLVLGLQAVIFFAVKFCKTKDRNYHTL
ncbi:sialomucin core protein 24 isoform X1 [Hemiscyllium ocellatum]|uniref:sialomucin core protein 24 isoform X1 n=1 Tax=Hemiscyllium ocellatum TaxID=170820 RepID=UPI002966C30D|nr:sialomucin core protein 24 isoform X1 [Hemiscyllium ocellatum]